MVVPVGMADDPKFTSLSATHRAVWLQIMLRGNNRHEPSRWWCQASSRWVDIPAYSFITTLERLADESGTTIGIVRRALYHCHTRGWISSKPTANRYTLISLLEARQWQLFETYKSKPLARTRAHDRHIGEHWSDQLSSSSLREEDNSEIKRVRRAKRTPDAFVPPDNFPGCRLAQTWRAALPHLAAHSEWAKVEASWLKAFDELHRIDGRSWADIAQLIGAIVEDTGDGKWPGWAKACQSPAKLRERDKYNRLYFDVIWEQLIARARGSPRQQIEMDAEKLFESWADSGIKVL